ncbi:MAG: MFS transporter [Leptolyngbyaceae bacterium]|nr:MFS transporter [Leptolyngbyaceae bacterium]
MSNKIFPQLHPQVWILALGRLLSQLGSGFTLFYAPIFFVNQVGLSATSVGIGLGSASISGLVGRVLGGSLADSPAWGRKRTVLSAVMISAIASLGLAATHSFPVFVAANLLMGLGIGLYWPANESMVADLTPSAQRNEAFAVTRLADHLGLSLGVVLGGALLGLTGAYRVLFVVDACSFLVFYGIVWLAIAETHPGATLHQPGIQGWKKAFRDRTLLVYVLANVLFTSYLAQIETTLPLYFTNFVHLEATGKGFSPTLISTLFAEYMGLSVLLQLPVSRRLNPIRRPRVLMLSALCWGLGFALIWGTGVVASNPILGAGVALAVFSLATVTYTPIASSLVAGLAPVELRGVYLSMNSLCWAIGYLIGPPLGGLAMDQMRPVADYFWLALALSVGVVLAILKVLDRMMAKD